LFTFVGTSRGHLCDSTAFLFVVDSASLSYLSTHLSLIPSVGLCVGVCVRRVYCGKTADWIRMPFGVVSGVGPGMSVLHRDGDLQREGAI